MKNNFLFKCFLLVICLFAFASIFVVSSCAIGFDDIETDNCFDMSVFEGASAYSCSNGYSSSISFYYDASTYSLFFSAVVMESEYIEADDTYNVGRYIEFPDITLRDAMPFVTSSAIYYQGIVSNYNVAVVFGDVRLEDFYSSENGNGIYYSDALLDAPLRIITFEDFYDDLEISNIYFSKNINMYDYYCWEFDEYQPFDANNFTGSSDDWQNGYTEGFDDALDKHEGDWDNHAGNEISYGFSYQYASDLYSDEVDIIAFARGFVDYFCGEFHYNCCAEKNSVYLAGYSYAPYFTAHLKGKEEGRSEGYAQGYDAGVYDALDKDTCYISDVYWDFDSGSSDYEKWCFVYDGIYEWASEIKSNLSNDNDWYWFCRGYFDWDKGMFHYNCCAEKNRNYLKGLTYKVREDGIEFGFLDGEQFGYSEGYTEGKSAGHIIGYKEGEQSTVTRDFKDIVSEIVFAPYNLMTTMFDFEIFGINVAGAVFTLFTIICIGFVVGFFIKMFV